MLGLGKQQPHSQSAIGAARCACAIHLEVKTWCPGQSAQAYAFLDVGSQVMKILLIGGNGFIGQRVVKQLASCGHELILFHRGSTPSQLARFARQMSGDANRLSEYRSHLTALAPDVVINFILSSGAQAQEMMIALHGIAGRVVVLSSMDVYRACGILHRTETGDLQQLPLTEDSELRTKPAYTPEQMEAGKKIFSWMTDEYDKIPVEKIVLSDSEIPATVLRLPMVYGPGDPLRRFLSIIKRIADGRRKIPLERQSAQFRGPKGYVENVARAITLAATSAKASARIYNVGEENAFTELKWAQLVARAMNWDGDFVLLPQEQMPASLFRDGRWEQHWVASSQRIREELGYSEDVSLEDGLERTIAWELANLPQQLPAALFDYAAEDAALRRYSVSSSAK